MVFIIYCCTEISCGRSGVEFYVLSSRTQSLLHFSWSALIRMKMLQLNEGRKQWIQNTDLCLERLKMVNKYLKNNTNYTDYEAISTDYFNSRKCWSAIQPSLSRFSTCIHFTDDIESMKKLILEEKIPPNITDHVSCQRIPYFSNFPILKEIFNHFFLLTSIKVLNIIFYLHNSSTNDMLAWIWCNIFFFCHFLVNCLSYPGILQAPSIFTTFIQTEDFFHL